MMRFVEKMLVWKGVVSLRRKIDQIGGRAFFIDENVHGIPRLKKFIEKLLVWKGAISLCRKINRAGGRALLVGGSVRDIFRCQDLNDFDIEVFGIEPDDLVQILARCFPLDLVGRDFGVIKIKNLPIDVSIPRHESKRGLGHKGFEVNSDPTMTIGEAAARRDFTINSMSFDPLTGELFDPFGGFRHLQERFLFPTSMMPGHPNPDAFLEDPLRVLRGAQFLARFEFDTSPELISICQRADIEGLSRERLFEEWRKLLLKGVKPSLGLEFLRVVGWLRFFPEIETLVGCVQDKVWHPEGDVWTHTLHCLDAFAKTRSGNTHEDLVVGLAVLCHDFGKPGTTELINGRWKSLRHESAGEEPTREFLSRLTVERDLADEVCSLVMEHLKPVELFNAQTSDSAIRRLAHRVGHVDLLVRVTLCDQAGRPPLAVDDRFVEWLMERVELLGVKDQAPKPIMMGRHLISLGFKPGKHFGPILNECFEAQLDGHFVDEEGGMKILRSIMGI